MTSRTDIGKVIESLAQDASIDIVRAFEDVAREFVASGGYGSLRMHVTGNERITDAFRATVNAMTMQASGCGNWNELREIVDAHLSDLIDQTIKMRVEQIGKGKMSSEEASALCNNLHQNLKRLKDAAVRNLRSE